MLRRTLRVGRLLLLSRVVGHLPAPEFQAKMIKVKATATELKRAK